MSEAEDDKKLEFELLARRAGLVIPEERREGFFKAFLDFRAMCERLHKPRNADVEVASVFSVESARRGAP